MLPYPLPVIITWLTAKNKSVPAQPVSDTNDIEMLRNEINDVLRGYT